MDARSGFDNNRKFHALPPQLAGCKLDADEGLMPG